MKNFKKIIMLLLAFALSVAPLLALTSCGGEETDCTEHNDADANGKCDYCDAEVEAPGTTYVVTVTDASGAPLAGAKVQLCLDGVAPVGAEVTTGADGKAAVTLKNEGNYHAKITSVPQGYVLPTSTTPLVNNATTVAVSSLPVYTVYVKDAAGNAISGVAVQICSASGACQLPKETDSEGKIESQLTEDSYKALIVDAPAGYVKPADYIMFEAGSKTLTITLELE